MNPLTALPAKARKAIYVFYATLGLVFGATQVAFATAQQDQPLWLLVAFGVFGYLGTALGLVAAANVYPGAGAQLDQMARYAKRLVDQRTAVDAASRDIAASRARLDGARDTLQKMKPPSE